jgi:predicted ester cyclase
MSTEENKANSRRLTERLNQGDLTVIDELCAPNHVSHNAQNTTHGPEEYKQSFSVLFTAFPDLHFTIEDMIAEGDKVVTRNTIRGTHQGLFRGIPPTGKHVTITGIAVSHWIAGKSDEVWINTDGLGLLQQIGALPTPGQAS